MPKVLFSATVDVHFQKFHIPYLKWFKEQGWEVHVASNGDMDLPYVDMKYKIDIQRSPFHPKNLNAYRELASIISKNKYDIIHCHTPMGGVLTRLAARKGRKHGTKVLYTAHGFHFCRGAPLMNWLIYYPIEKALAYFTDCLITINSEDYELAHRHRFKAARIEHVHGVGIDLENFKPTGLGKKEQLRMKYGYRTDDIVLFYAAEFNKNKNQKFLIEAFATVSKQADHARLLLAGAGPLLDECRILAAKLSIQGKVDFLGYRDDIKALLSMSDVAVASSIREGLPVNIMEAMACGLPVVATRNRGHSELIMNDVNGYTVATGDKEAFADHLVNLSFLENKRKLMGDKSLELMGKYSLTYVKLELIPIYMQYMSEEGRNETKDQYNRAYI